MGDLACKGGLIRGAGVLTEICQIFQVARLAALSSDALLTPRQAAAIVGVSESTVRRWCDDRLIATARTSGGHRRIARAALLAHARRSGFAPRTAPILAGRGGRSAPIDELADRFFHAVVGSGPGGGRVFTAEWLGRGDPVDLLFDAVIAPAMRRVGRDWEVGALAVFEEHRATASVIGALGVVESLLPMPSRKAPTAVCAALSGDPYSLAPSMAAAVLQGAGYQPVLLGADTPAAEVLRAADLGRARLVSISIGVVVDEARLCRDLDVLAGWARRAGAAVAVGGRALDAALRGRLRADLMGGTITDLAGFARRFRTGGRRAGGPRRESDRACDGRQRGAEAAAPGPQREEPIDQAVKERE